MGVTINKTVFIGSDANRRLNSFIKKNKYNSCFIICDSNTLHYCLPSLVIACPALKEAELIELEPGEESKDIEVAISIWETLTEAGADKKSLVINLGGGVVSDIGGFAASTFKRGIDFINIPTTLLAMADASVGGKTGFNLKGIKNLIGTITQPRAVFVDPTFLRTLSHRHLVNGYAEIIKIALIRDKSFFRSIAGLTIKTSFADQKIISKSIALKNAVVVKDPTDKNLRKILNFGHTVGHALESVFLNTTQPLLHGEAIAIGIAMESYLCLLLKRISKQEFEKIIRCLALNFNFRAISPNDFDAILHIMTQDKKNSDRNYMFALLNGIGKCHPSVKVTRANILKALHHYNSNIANAASV